MKALIKAAEVVVEAHHKGYGKIAHDVAVENLSDALNDSLVWQSLSDDDYWQLWYRTSGNQVDYAKAVAAELRRVNGMDSYKVRVAHG